MFSVQLVFRQQYFSPRYATSNAVSRRIREEKKPDAMNNAMIFRSGSATVDEERERETLTPLDVTNMWSVVVE